jgi:putative hydrolase of the HAD superfamily
MMKKYTRLFFDLDRTLWDFESNSLETFQELYNEFSLRMYFSDFFTFHREFKEINEVLWEKYRKDEISKDDLRWKRFYNTLVRFNCDDISFSKQIADYYIEKSPQKKKLFPGTLETIKVLREKYKLYILTNGFSEVQYVKMDHCGLTEFFERVFTSEEVGVHKPHAKFFNYVLTELDVKPENCLMIGDDFTTDIMGAKNCDIDQVFFNPTKCKVDGQATYQIEKMNELIKILA